MRANEGSLPRVRTALLLLGGMVCAGFAGVLTYLDTGRPIAGALAAATSLPAAIAFLDRIIHRPLARTRPGLRSSAATRSRRSPGPASRTGPAVRSRSVTIPSCEMAG